MKRFLKGIKGELVNRGTEEANPATAPQSVAPPSATNPPQKSDWLKYRKHRGVNLGSWFVLERWITDTPFRQAASPQASDLDVAKGTNAKSILERHWDTWITQRDWNWMTSVGINSVRIPIGYYHVCGADKAILNDTDFFPYYDVYSGAWKRITDAILTASRRNITVLIDLHAAPGKQNADPHSGTSLPANFFNDPHNLRRGLYALRSLSQALQTFCTTHRLQNLIGIELVNEPAPPNDRILRDWYIDAVKEVRRGAPGIPIYLGECWRLASYAEWVGREHAKLTPRPDGGLVVLDHHLYRCFTQQDTRTSIQDHTKALQSTAPGSMYALFERSAETLGRVGGGLVVAEWSCGMAPSSLRNISGERAAFVKAQLALYEKWCGGWWWWTLKKEEGVYPRDLGWSFKDAVGAGVFPSFVGLKRKKPVDTSTRERTRRQAVLASERRRAYLAHQAYWKRTPVEEEDSERYGREVFVRGFVDGFNDNYSVFEGLGADAEDVSEIGFREAWARERSRGVRELEDGRGGIGNDYWEYEHGFLQGCDAARADFEKVFC